jgi:hypothetical protein
MEEPAPPTETVRAGLFLEPQPIFPSKERATLFSRKPSHATCVPRRRFQIVTREERIAPGGGNPAPPGGN